MGTRRQLFAAVAAVVLVQIPGVKAESDSTYGLRTACQWGKEKGASPNEIRKWLHTLRYVHGWNPPDCDWSVCRL